MAGTAGLSKERLGRLDAAMAGYVTRGTVPGVVTLVARGEDVHVGTAGTSALGGGAAVGRDTIFRVASMSKPVTAVAALILVEECRLRLDDPVDELLPELAGRQVLRTLESELDDTVPAARPITLRDLLTFTFGIGMLWPPVNGPIQAAMAGRLGYGPPNPAEVRPPDEWMKRLGELPLLFQPGQRWLYHTGSDVLGVLIARAAGQPFEDFLAERIFAPLGMRDSGFFVPAGKLGRFTTSYFTDRDTGALIHFDDPDGQWAAPPAFPSGGGGMVSTVDDFLAFSRMLLGGGTSGGERVLSPASVELMTGDRLTPAQKAGASLVGNWFDSHGWGFGVGVVTRRDDLTGNVGAYGWDGGLGSSWLCDPADDLVTIVLTQAAFSSPDPPRVIQDFRTLAYQALEN